MNGKKLSKIREELGIDPKPDPFESMEVIEEIEAKDAEEENVEDEKEKENVEDGDIIYGHPISADDFPDSDYTLDDSNDIKIPFYKNTNNNKKKLKYKIPSTGEDIEPEKCIINPGSSKNNKYEPPTKETMDDNKYETFNKHKKSRKTSGLEEILKRDESNNQKNNHATAQFLTVKDYLNSLYGSKKDEEYF
jgi:hypothetical protein